MIRICNPLPSHSGHTYINLAVRLRLELRKPLSWLDGLAIRSNTIIGPHHKITGYTFSYALPDELIFQLAENVGIEPTT